MNETFRSDFGLYSNKNLPSLIISQNQENQKHFIPYDSPFDTYGNMSFGTGAIGDIRQDIGHSIRPGFGRETGSFFPRSVRRKFNIEFQRGSYNKCKTGINEYMYECGMPSSYYPITYVDSYPYSKNYDPYPYHEDEIGEFCNSRKPKLVRSHTNNHHNNNTQTNDITIYIILVLFIIILNLF